MAEFLEQERRVGFGLKPEDLDKKDPKDLDKATLLLMLCNREMQLRESLTYLTRGAEECELNNDHAYDGRCQHDSGSADP